MNNRIKQRYEKNPIMDVCPDDGQCVSGGGYHHPLQWCDGKGDATEEGQRECNVSIRRSTGSNTYIL